GRELTPWRTLPSGPPFHPQPPGRPPGPWHESTPPAGRPAQPPRPTSPTPRRSELVYTVTAVSPGVPGRAPAGPPPSHRASPAPPPPPGAFGLPGRTARWATDTSRATG